MASTSLTTSAGIRLTAASFKVRSTSLTTSAGVSSSPQTPPWAGSGALLSRVPWIPKAGTPLSLDNGRTLNPVWDRCLRWLFEEAIGGLSAPTPAQTRETVAQVQVQVVDTANYTEQVAAYATGIATTTQATVEVAQSNGLTGAESIPAPPEPPTRSGTQPV